MKPLARSRFSPTRAVALALALLASPALLVNQASAVTYTWTGATNNFWSGTTNWDLGSTPAVANTTDVIIGGTTNVGNMISGDPFTIKSLTFADSNDADTLLNLQQTGNGGSGSNQLTFSSNSGNATLTVIAGSTGNKTITRYFNGGSGTSNVAL